MANILMVGEQPGDQEDQQGHPFVGPAGRLLRQLCEEAGLDRADVFLTNAVKHFKWKPSGKKRLHQKPNGGEIHACNPWLEGEVRAVAPRIIVCLGATAAAAVMWRAVPIGASRNKKLISKFEIPARVTWHPSAILRVPDREARERMRGELIEDLRRAQREI